MERSLPRRFFQASAFHPLRWISNRAYLCDVLTRTADDSINQTDELLA